MQKMFKDRKAAGKCLAESLVLYKGKPDAIILALPRGGVPVACEVSEALRLPMDILLVRKLGVPGHEELAMGAIALNGASYINEDIMRSYSISWKKLTETILKEKEELARRDALYRQGRPMPDLRLKTVILIDDGLATGATVRAAISAAKDEGASRIVVGVPIAAREAFRTLENIADEVVSCRMPEPFYSVGQWYEDFPQVSDAEVQRIMKEAMLPEFLKLRK